MEIILALLLGLVVLPASAQIVEQNSNGAPSAAVIAGTYVPYTGATGAVTLGTNGLTAGSITGTTGTLTGSSFSVGGSTLNVNNGRVGIGAASAVEKLEIYDGGLRLTGSAISQPMAVVAPSNVYFKQNWATAADGGVITYAMSDTDRQPYALYGVFGTNNPTDATPAISFGAGKSDGSNSWTTLAAAETVFRVDNLVTPLMTVLGSGNVGIGVTDPDTTLEVNGQFKTGIYNLAAMDALAPTALGAIITVSDAAAPYSVCVATATAAGSWVKMNTADHCQ